MLGGERRFEFSFAGERYTCRKQVYSGSESVAEHTLSEPEVRYVLQQCALQGRFMLLDELHRFAGTHPRDPRGLSELAARLTDPLLGNLVLQRRTPRGLPLVPLVDLTPPPIDEEEILPEYWAEIEVLDAERRPVAQVACEIELPGGRRLSRTTDTRGIIRVEGIRSSGDCLVRFPHQVVEPDGR